MLNADDVSTLTATPNDLTDKNLFSYCDNNPVIRADSEGSFWHIVAGTAIGAIAGGVVKAVCNIAEGKKWSTGIGTAMLTGAASGALASTGVGLVGQISGNAAISATGNAFDQVVKNKGISNFNVGSMVMDGVVGGVAGRIGGKGLGTKALNNLGKQTIKKTFKKLTHQGIKAAARVVKKSSSYYTKMAGYVYVPIVRGILKSNIPSATYNLSLIAYNYYNR